jgi:voltage-gated potassium channel
MEWPLTIAALVFLAAYAWEVIGDLRGTGEIIAETVINITWAVFVIDYVVTLILAKPRWKWFYTHLFDLAIVVLPMLRPLRLLRLVTLLTILQRAAGPAFRGRVVIYVIGAVSLLVFVAALAMLDTERSAPGSLITTFPDSLWWAVVTITTVGYGDVYPVTELGRVIAVGVMLGGIALLGIVTATLASWIVDRVARQDEQAQAATRKQVADLANEVAELKQRIVER